jgi:F-type H+-transporting ATPase subunit a
MFLFAEGGGEQEPLIVQFINDYVGEPVLKFEKTYTEPFWNDKIFSHFGTTAAKVFGPYTLENAIPWYTIMFFIACILTIVAVWILKGKLSEDDPKHGQLTLEAAFIAMKDLIVSLIGDRGYKYFPVVATFAILILVSNLMGLFPLFKAPTASTTVTLALGISCFVYYTFIGIKENGLIKYFAHFTGPRLPFIMTLFITPLIFGIELISNLIRPLTLGVRLFANMFADETIGETVANIYPPFTQFLVPVALLPLALFVAFVQAFVFTLLSMIYLSEVSHGEHAEHGNAEAHHADEHTAVAAAA